jgi:hypothetical protein
MLKKGEYQYDMDAHNHETEMTQYCNFFEKNGKKPLDFYHRDVTPPAGVRTPAGCRNEGT